MEYEIGKVDKAALELTLQNGCEPLVSPLGGKVLDIKLNFIKPTFPIVEDKLTVKLYDAVHKNMEKHEGKKIAFNMSGGVDSTLTLHILKHLYPDLDLHGYHLYFGDPTRDERRYARLAANYYDVPLTMVSMDAHRMIELIPECVKASNVVMAATVYSYGMAKKQAEDGMDVVLHSLGPDEYFGAYAIDKRYYERIPFFGWCNTHGKLAREFAKRYGTDKAFFVNNLALSPGRKHIKNTSYSVSKWYKESFMIDLWTTIKRWQWERGMGGQYRLNAQPVEHFEMESVAPLLEKNLAEYCFGCTPLSVYNKKPIRSLMRDWNVPEEIVRRGEDWKIGSDDKVGWCPSDAFYQGFTARFFPDNGFPWSHNVLAETFTTYVQENIKKWIVLGDRRAQQIGLFLRMLEMR